MVDRAFEGPKAQVASLLMSGDPYCEESESCLGGLEAARGR